VKVGVYADLRNPPAWRRPWAEHYARTLDRIAGAERLGIDSAWVTEHHFFEDGYLPQPLTLAAAIAARTSRIRIGTAVMLAPLRAPIQIAEEAAVVELVSDGRLELGLGARLPRARVPGLRGRPGAALRPAARPRARGAAPLGRGDLHPAAGPAAGADLARA